jgi:diguanylate cyclase (GGDEF)-like protein
VATSFEPDVLLDRVRAIDSRDAIALEYRGALTERFAIGRIPGHHDVISHDEGGGWTVSVYQRDRPGGVVHDQGATLVLVGGSVMSLLVATLLLVLATGRERALRLVAEATATLRHQALHDPLTGLANRRLMNDRIEQVLRRSRRHGGVPVALYLDIDGFKQVNDTLGHEAGDLLLQAVAARLRSAVRDADAIARFGGDEFVVLLDAAMPDAGPEVVASRILAVLHEPFTDLADGSVHVSVSIGIAVGDRPDAETLLRDADVALYRSKAAGKDRYTLFEPTTERAAQLDEEPIAGR